MRDPSRRGRQDLPSSRRKPLGHAFLFAEQGNRVRIPDTEGIHRRIAVCTFEIASARQDSESSCNSKVLFSMRGNPRVRWKPVIGRAVMARREGWSNAFVRGKILRTWIDKSEDLQIPKRRIGSMAIASYPHTFPFRFGVKETRHKGDGYDNHRFFDT